MGLAPSSVLWIEMGIPNLTIATETQGPQQVEQIQQAGRTEGQPGEGVLRLTPMGMQALRRFMEGKTALVQTAMDNAIEQVQLGTQRAVHFSFPHVLLHPCCTKRDSQTARDTQMHFICRT